MSRRLPAVILVVAALVAIIVTTRDPIEAEVPVFSSSAGGWMPFAPTETGLTETWFCPGVPATGVDGVEGSVLIANRGSRQMVGTVVVLNEQQSQRMDLTVEPFATSRIDLDATLPGEMVGAVVELERGGAVVEQVATHPSGDSVAPCANATSDAWYLADGFTVDASVDQVVLTNPFDQIVVANLEFSTQEGSRSPAIYRGITVAPRSVRVIDLGAPGAGAQDEPLLAARVETSRGRLVVGRWQEFAGGGRGGAQTAVASPALRDQWWFSEGEKRAGVDEQFSIYNPTDRAVEVDPIFIGLNPPVIVDPIEVLANQVVTFDSGSVADLPEGRHATVFSTQSEPSIVVERALTRTVDGELGTTVVAGATPRQDGYVASQWFVAAAPSEPTTAGLVVYNADNTPATVSVAAVGSSGPEPVPSLQDIAVEPASVITIDLTDDLVLGRQLVVESTGRVFVERSSPTGREGIRTSSWALPAG